MKIFSPWQELSHVLGEGNLLIHITGSRNVMDSWLLFLPIRTGAGASSKGFCRTCVQEQASGFSFLRVVLWKYEWLALWIWLLCVMIYFIWAIELNSSGNNFATDLKLSQWLRTKCSGFPSQPRTFAFLSLCNVKLCTEVSTFTKNNICTPHTSENRPAGSVNVCSYIGIYVFNIGSTFDSI